MLKVDCLKKKAVVGFGLMVCAKKNEDVKYCIVAQKEGKKRKCGLKMLLCRTRWWDGKIAGRKCAPCPGQASPPPLTSSLPLQQ